MLEKNGRGNILNDEFPAGIRRSIHDVRGAVRHREMFQKLFCYLRVFIRHSRLNSGFLLRSNKLDPKPINDRAQR